MLGNNGSFSYSPRGLAPEDLPQNRRGFQHDDQKFSPLQRNDMSRPSGRSIYMQRKEYSESLNRQPENFHVRVEHLFTCEMDGEVRTLDDCVAKLKMLDAKGRLWPQDMLMDVQRGYLLLSDIETKAELESISLGSIVETNAVLDSCAYNSLLTVTVEQRRRSQVFMFQCEETAAELVKSDLDKAIQRGGDDLGPRREPPDIRSDLENIIGQQRVRHPSQQDRALSPPPPPEDEAPRWSNREPDYIAPSRVYAAPEEEIYYPDSLELQNGPEMLQSPEITDFDRNVDILNHVLADVEIFSGKVAAAANAASQPGSKKKKLLRKNKPKKTVSTLPPWPEFISCLQKIKYGFNLLAQLDGSLNSPSAPDYVHIFFSTLHAIVIQYPADLPPTVVSPLLTDMAVGLLREVVSPEEDQLWGTLGESWNIPRSRWPDDNVPPYIPDFYDGWQPPAPSHMSTSYHNGALSRSNSQRFPPDWPNDNAFPGAMEDVAPGPWGPPPPPLTSERPLYMRAMYDFRARNNQELSIMSGEVVQVVQKNKQWWLVRNSHDEEGNVPQKVLEAMRDDGSMDDLQPDTRAPVTLQMYSTAAEVKAWLQYKGFSKNTVSILGMLSGQQLMRMSQNEIKSVCPEEGGKVFFQLQAVKSAIALASEPSGMYNGHY